MKIALVIDQLDCGGAEQQLVTLALGLRRRGHEVHVITIHDRMALRTELDSAGIPITIAYKRATYDLTTVWRLCRLIRAVEPDLVHAYLPTASLLTPLCRWLGVAAPLLLSERGINTWRSPMRIRLEHLLRRNVEHITCNAYAIKRHLVSAEGMAADKISVIYNGLRVDRREAPDPRSIAAAQAQIGAPPDAFVVICVANFSPVKQHDVLLDAFAQARKRARNLFLVLVGRGELESQIRLRIGALGVNSACLLITDCDNPRALLCASQGAVLTSSLEGCSNAVLEAMALGLPIVASDAGGNPELVMHERGGYVCPVGDVGAVAAALIRLEGDPRRAIQMGAHNRQRVARCFSDNVMVDATVALYQTVLRRSSTPVASWQNA